MPPILRPTTGDDPQRFGEGVLIADDFVWGSPIDAPIAGSVGLLLAGSV